MKEVYMIGGAKGVGKSSVIKLVSESTGLPVINTGDFFSGKEPKIDTISRIVEYLHKNAPLIADTHYAGFVNGVFGGQFERALPEEHLELLSKNAYPELFLIDLHPDELLMRRRNDIYNKRDLNSEHATRELEENRRYFSEYCKQLKKEGYVIPNDSSEESARKVLLLIQNQSLK
jgi:adenylate kinase